MQHLENVSNTFPADNPEHLTNQALMIGESLTAIQKMYKEGGYVTPRGHFIPFSARDLLFLQQSLDSALRLRSDLLMIPFGVEQAVNMATATAKLEKQASSENPNVGLQEPPEMSPIDGPRSEENTFESTVKEQAEEVMIPIALPQKT